MSISQAISQQAPTVSAIATLALIVFLVWKEARSGAKGISNEVINNFKTLDEQQKDTIASKDQAIGELKVALRKANEECIAQTSKLEGTVEQQAKTIARQDDIIKNRNPELIEILTKVADFMEKLTQRMDLSQNELVKQTEIMTQSKKRDERIDEGHKTLS